MNLPPPRPADPRLQRPRPIDPRPTGSRPAEPHPAEPGRTEPGVELHDAEPAAVVARAMTGLDGLERLPLSEHVVVFEQVHAALSEALTAGSPAIG